MPVTSPIGSSSAATCISPSAIPAIRSSVKRRRSTRLSGIPFSLPFFTSKGNWLLKGCLCQTEVFPPHPSGPDSFYLWKGRAQKPLPSGAFSPRFFNISFITSPPFGFCLYVFLQMIGFFFCNDDLGKNIPWVLWEPDPGSEMQKLRPLSGSVDVFPDSGHKSLLHIPHGDSPLSKGNSRHDHQGLLPKKRSLLLPVPVFHNTRSLTEKNR